MIRRTPVSEDVLSEARAWLSQLETGNLDRADVEALREWLSRSPVHARELKKLIRLSGELNVLTEMAPSLEQAAADYHPVTVSPSSRRYRAWQLPAKVAAMAAICLLAFAGILRFMDGSDTSIMQDAGISRSLITSVGQYEEYRLPDGSVISLNAASNLHFTYTTNIREVFLNSGEALFTVVSDPSRPFVVRAGGRRVEAVGTSFLVRIEPGSLEVSVNEGRVQVFTEPLPDFKQRERPSPIPVLLEVGQRIVMANDDVDQPPMVSPMDDGEMRRKLAWREGLLDFHRTPLSKVVEDVNRHSGRQIRILDEELRSREFDGLFRIGETDLLLNALDMRDDIEVTVLEDESVVLSRASLDEEAF